jgi:tRNA-binding EMAP/Myf-like protein
MKLSNGDMTDKGLVKMVDKPWKDKDGNDADILVITTEGKFRLSEVVKIDKAVKPKFEVKPMVDFPNVMSLDIRPGRVKSAEKVKKTDNLILLKVSTNVGTLTVVTNLGSKYETTDFIDRTFLFIMNLNPIKIKGIESQAMLMGTNVNKFNPKTNTFGFSPELMEVNIPIDSVIFE